MSDVIQCNECEIVFQACPHVAGLASENERIRNAAREILGWNWEAPEHLDWTEVRVDVANLRRALGEPQPESADG